MVAELRFVKCLKNEAYYFFEQFVRPWGESEGAFLAIAFGNVDSFDWTPHVPLISQSFNDGRDFVHGHTISRFFRDPWCHGSLVPINLPVGHEIEVRVEQQPVHSFQW